MCQQCVLQLHDGVYKEGKGTQMDTSCCVSFLLCLCMYLASCHVNTNDPFIMDLFQKVENEQILQDQDYRTLISWQKSKGGYPSYIIFNFHGNFPIAKARHVIQIFDNNIFTTAWVSISLLEAFVYGGAPRPSDDQLVRSLNAMKEYQDRNTPYNTSVVAFWQQQFNHSTNYWNCKPINLLGSIQLLNSLPLHAIGAFLKAMGLGDLAKLIDSIQEEESTLLTAISVPPDFDDTFVNLALGSLLCQQKEDFPVAWALWNSHNPNITSVFHALKKYAYRPFSSDVDLNSVDPRTYFHIRGFLDRAQASGQDVALVPTWIQNIDEERKEFHLGVAMPFGVNNIDVTVSANTVYAITSGVLGGLLSPGALEDPAIEQIYHNTSALIVFEIMNNFSGRPDLALTYYPSRMEFYWFVTRTLYALETYRRTRTLPVKVMESVYKTFRDVAENHMTKDILNLAKGGEAGVYFDDFLGDGDVTFGGRPVNRAEDRIFTTTMAALALASAWSYYDALSRKSHWKEGTPRVVMETAAGCITWLRQHSLSGEFKPWNAFFSGSVKSFNTLPFWYPGNRLEYLNGTTISDWSDIPNSTFIYAVQGYIPARQYNAMLKEKHFGYPTPMDFHGYNNDSGIFPLWSSETYTYSAALLAVSTIDQTML